MKKIFFAAMTGALLTVSCENDSASSSNGMANVKVMLTDAPARYDRVNVQIQSVESAGLMKIMGMRAPNAARPSSLMFSGFHAL